MADAITRDGSTPNNAFLLKDLHALNVGAHVSYLEPKSAVFRKIFIYSSFDARNTGRGVVGAFVLEGTNKGEGGQGRGQEEGQEEEGFTAKAYVWLVQPGAVSW